MHRPEPPPTSELVFALALRPAGPGARWHARLVAADGGQVIEFEALTELVRHLAQLSRPGVPLPDKGIR